MLLRYFYDKTLAQASYMVGCSATGEALIVDPSRDIQQYLDAAEAEGLAITHVTETHIHADYVSGSRELASESGARLYLSDMGDEFWKYGFVDDHTILLRDGDSWMVGNIRVEVIHTPGHTPESISFMITDTAGADKPIGIFTGDFLFVGDIGRPDLLDEAAGFVGTREVGARQQFANVQRFKDMPDYLQIWPAHGAGSACGKALGAVPSTTLGYEKLFNPAFQFDSEQPFVDWLLKDQPEAPRYFAQMKHVNKVGPALLADLPVLRQMSADELSSLVAQGAQIVDARSQADYAAGHVPGTLNVPGDTQSFSTYVGWYVDFEHPFYLIAAESEVERLVTELRAVGVDNIAGYFTPDVLTGQLSKLDMISPSEVSERMPNNGFWLLDVRGATEYSSEHIPGARNIPMGYLPRHFEELPRDELIITQCAGGLRSQIAASLLLKHGFSNVQNMTGGFSAWKDAGLPVEQA